MEMVNEFDLEYRNGDSGVKYLFRGPNIDWGVIRFLPNDTLGRHYHEEVEETFYFLNGRPEMVVNGEVIRIKPGDVVRLEPEDIHDIVNDTDEVINVLFMKHIHKPDDKVDVKDE